MSKNGKYKTAKMYNELCLLFKEKYNKPEEWRILVYNGITTPYAISNYGRIFDLDNMTVPRMHIRSSNSSNYYIATIKTDAGKKRLESMHRLVALTFIPIPERYLKEGYTEKDLVVDHIRDCEEDNHDDNTIWNLQWLTQFENGSKYNSIAYARLRSPFTVEFRQHLDKMICDDFDNDEIYKVCLEKYGYTKKEIKATLQVRRRRLGKTLKEHHENDVEFVAKIDDLLKKGYSNDEIIDELDMSREGRASERLLQYRRSILKIPANVSKYLNNEQNKILNSLIEKGIGNAREICDEIIKIYDLKLSDEDCRKFILTIRARIRLYKNKHKDVSSTTIESIS